MLQPFKFSVGYKPGTTNKVADFLSQCTELTVRSEERKTGQKQMLDRESTGGDTCQMPQGNLEGEIYRGGKGNTEPQGSCSDGKSPMPLKALAAPPETELWEHGSRGRITVLPAMRGPAPRGAAGKRQRGLKSHAGNLTGPGDPGTG